MHFIELSKIDLEQADNALARWMRFLLARNEDELEEIAMSDPNIRRASEAPKALSEDPEVQELARQREMSQINLKIMHQFAVEEGEAKGLRHEVQTVARMVGVELNESRIAELETLGTDALKRLVGTLEHERRWPERL
jgi:cell fate (sporulation/competence/biofilm development) regulator YlbF (YheA/YmcA/DUF963 family)